MSEPHRETLFDPEPFTVLVGVAGIVGGVASVVATVKIFVRDSPVRARRAALLQVNQAHDELRYLAADLATVQEVLKDAEIPGNRSFRPGTVAFLTHSQFARYERATDQMYGRLRKLLKVTNRLDRLLPRLPDVTVSEAAKQIDDARAMLSRLLRDPDMSMDQALKDLASVIQQVSTLVDGLRADLHG
jgi:hypothetical protein